MTVQEAKTKVCPFMSNQVGEHTLTFLTVNCICGDCMAWVFTKTHSQWHDESYVVREGRFHVEKWRPSELKQESKEGYCARIGQ